MIKFTQIRIAVLFLLRWPHEAEGQTPQAVCSVRVDRQSPIAVSGDRLASIDVQSLAEREGLVLALGPLTHIWRRSENGSYELEDGASIGLLRNRDGQWARVPAPPIQGTVVFARAVFRDSAGWTALLGYTPIEENEKGSLVVPSAQLWTAEYRDGRWDSPELIGSLKNARVRDRASSQLISLPYGNAWAYAFERPAAGEYDQGGIVMVSRRGTNWGFDTLRTWRAPTQVRLAASPRGNQIWASYAAAHFKNRQPQPSALFNALFDDGWGNPTLIHADSVTLTTHPEFAVLESGPVWAWVTRARKSHPGESASLEIGTLPSLGARLTLRAEGAVTGIAPVAAAGSGAATQWWIARAAPDSIHILLTQPGGNTALVHRIATPSPTLSIAATAIASDRLLVLSSAFGNEFHPELPRAWTVETLLSTVCRN